LEKTEAVIALEVSEKALQIMRERNETYKTDQKDNIYIQIMLLLYPKGVPGEYVAMMRYKFVSYIVDKLVRCIIAAPHENSLIDIGNYSFMLASFDRRIGKVEGAIQQRDKIVEGAIEKEIIK
jgi:hypothetical protein